MNPLSEPAEQNATVGAVPNNSQQMTLVGHLGELRRRLVVSVVAIVAGSSGAYIFVEDLMRFVIAPAGRLYFMSPAEGFFSFF